MNKTIVTLLILTATVSVIAAEGFSSLQEQMTGKEFNAAGLDKLSEQELDELNAWIRKHSLATLATTASTSSKAASGDDDKEEKTSDKKDKDTSTVNSKLVGKFSGWDGQTVFKLENGMIWAQASKKKFYTDEIVNPAVEVKHGMFGRWYLTVEGIDEEVKVRRIQ